MTIYFGLVFLIPGIIFLLPSVLAKTGGVWGGGVGVWYDGMIGGDSVAAGSSPGRRMLS